MGTDKAGVFVNGTVRGVIDLRPFKGRSGDMVEGVKVYVDVDELEPVVLDVYAPDAVKALKGVKSGEHPAVELSCRIDRKSGKCKVVAAAVL